MYTNLYLTDMSRKSRPVKFVDFSLFTYITTKSEYTFDARNKSEKNVKKITQNLERPIERTYTEMAV